MLFPKDFYHLTESEARDVAASLERVANELSCVSDKLLESGPYQGASLAIGCLSAGVKQASRAAWEAVAEFKAMRKRAMTPGETAALNEARLKHGIPS